MPVSDRDGFSCGSSLAGGSIGGCSVRIWSFFLAATLRDIPGAALRLGLPCGWTPLDGGAPLLSLCSK